MTAFCAHSQLQTALHVVYVWITLCCILLPLATSADSVDGLSHPIGADHLIWWVQLSDVHVSVFNPSRVQGFEDFFIPAMQLIRPSVILITGDLTDAKDRRRTTTRQDEVEWRHYRRSLDHLAAQCHLSPDHILDVRGNHDTFKVAQRGEPQDLYSLYSNAGQLARNRTSVYSFTLTANNISIRFVSLDAAPRVGIGGPVNFFGHVTDADLALLDSTLSESHTSPSATSATASSATASSANASSASVTTVVMGHYPLSFVARSPSGFRVQDVLHRHRQVEAYVAGHLHHKFGTKMVRHHDPMGERQVAFWEWAAGDWKDNRKIRIMASDRGVVSFLDLKLVRHPPHTHPQPGIKTTEFVSAFHLNPAVLITSPPDSRYLTSNGKETAVTDWVSRTGKTLYIRLLVFASQKPKQVQALVYTHKSPGPTPLLSSILEGQGEGSVYFGSMNLEPVHSQGLEELWLEIRVTSGDDNSIYTPPPQPFSVTGKRSHLDQTWIERTLMYTDWEGLWPWALWGMYSFLLAMLALPRGVVQFLRAPGGWDDFRERAISKIKGGIGSGDHNRLGSWCHETGVGGGEREEGASALLPASPPPQPCSWPAVALWLVAEASLHRVWWGQVAFLIYLPIGPLFWGYPVGQSQPFAPAPLSVWGWRIGSSQSDSVPDILIILIPYLYLGLLPLFFFIAATLIDRSIDVAEREVKEKGRGGAGRRRAGGEGGGDGGDGEGCSTSFSGHCSNGHQRRRVGGGGAGGGSNQEGGTGVGRKCQLYSARFWSWVRKGVVGCGGIFVMGLLYWVRPHTLGSDDRWRRKGQCPCFVA